MGRNWRPRSIFICERCYIWRVRVSAPRCCENRLCRKVERDQMNAQQIRNLETANSRS